MSVNSLLHFPPPTWSYLNVQSLEAVQYLRTIPITTAERDFIIAEDGMIVFNGEENEFQSYYNTTWNTFGATGPTGPQSSILTLATGTLSSAQIDDLSSTGIQIVAAQGANTVIVPIFVTLQFKPGNTGYTGGTDFSPYIWRGTVGDTGPAGSQAIVVFTGWDLTAFGTSGFYDGNPSLDNTPASITTANNKPLWISNMGVDVPSGGDGTIIWTVIYSLRPVY